MTAEGRIERDWQGEDSVEPGRRLIRLGDKGLSLSERLSTRWHHFVWRTPLHRLRLRGKFPLKLVAVPDDPLPGNPARGAALLEGRAIWRGEEIALDAIDFADLQVSPGFADYLQSFAWLRDLGAVANRVEGSPVAESLTRKWLESHAEKVGGEAWRADIWGWRVFMWASHAPLILSSADLVYRSAVLNTIARGARHLDRTADKAPLGVKRVAAWAGVIAAGLVVQGEDA
ncbi:MAG: heparinase, partial [Sphingomonadaceae bacterium]|nr:heparinase [Sphingomonadaceae bacterium]